MATQKALAQARALIGFAMQGSSRAEVRLLYGFGFLKGSMYLYSRYLGLKGVPFFL